MGRAGVPRRARGSRLHALAKFEENACKMVWGLYGRESIFLFSHTSEFCGKHLLAHEPVLAWGPQKDPRWVYERGPEGPEGTARKPTEPTKPSQTTYLILKATTAYLSEQACRLTSRSRGGYSGSGPANQHHDCSPGSCGGGRQLPPAPARALWIPGRWPYLPSADRWQPPIVDAGMAEALGRVLLHRPPSHAPARPTVCLWERRGGNQNAARGAAG